jgi:hypothetical protein
LERDERYLSDKGYDWELITEGANELLVLKGVSVDAAKFDRAVTDVLIVIPPQYNTAPLDMWFVEPWVKLRNGSFPPQAEVPVQFMGRTWQRFSRHLPVWRPGVDNLTTLLVFMSRELCVPAEPEALAA